jgi:1-deoxy-D-xylulose-5-phosphate reductoisomerase
MKSLAILGSTGSIGTSTLSVVEAYPDRFRVAALAAGRNLTLLSSQIARHRPSVVAVAEQLDADSLSASFSGIRVLYGVEGLVEVACHPEAEMVVAALVGAVGLEPTVAAIRAGKDIALANKETLVVAGEPVMREVERAGVHLLPVDSEHNAIHQAMQVGPRNGLRRLILTASGGPFRSWPGERIQSATVADALAHPTWKMGAKITIDSATMMNKGLEIIEAHHLFGVDEGRIDVLVHPQSLVHSLVEYIDGTLIAQLSINDMRVSILYALAWPERLDTMLDPLDLIEAGRLSFEAPDPIRFPALDLARTALRSGGEMPAVLNAANEVAVQAFLDGKCRFGAIAATVRSVMEQWEGRNTGLESIEQSIAADREARRLASHGLGNSPPTVMGSE